MKEVKKIMSESDSDGVPELVDSSDDETTETSETENTNEINAKTWLDKNVKFHERQERNLRVFSLGPFLFGVNTFIPKPWMCAMLDAGLLLNARRETEITVLDWTEWALVDLVEQVVLVMLKKLRKKSYLLNCLDFIKEVEALQQKEEKIDVDTAIDKAGEFMHVKKIWTRSLKTLPCKQKERETKFAVLYVAKLYHILILGIGRDSKDVAEEMKKALKDKTAIALKYKDAGNIEYGKGHYEAATDYYTQAAKADPLNHIYYGNRSQAYSRQKKFKEALADGRRTSTLEPNWMKGLYRYAQAFAELDKLDMAIAINERGLRICERPGHKKDESYFSEIKGQGKKLYREREMRNIKRVLENKDYANKFLEEELPAELRNLPGKKRVIKLSEALSGLTEKPPTAVEEIPESDISEGSSDEEPMSEPLSESPPEIEQEIAPPKEIIQEVALESRTELIKDKDKASELRHLLSDGTMALTKDLGKEAVTSYNRALELTINFDMKTLDIEEADLVVLKYAFGIAAVSTGMYKNIMDGIQKFTEITKEHHDFKFPLAYYGLGKAFITLNRFTEALPPLEKGLSMVERSGTNMISWPGSDKKIEESNSNKLRALLKELIRIGKLPPKPDAVCRYHCDEDDGRTAIYFSDPDFKGFVRILCRAQCCIEFHNNCWRIFKTRFDKTTDKDILDKPCPTPDCGTTIVKICIFRQDALLKEMESERVENKPVSKSKKPAEKLPPSSAYKIQRKQDRKLLRQQKKKEIRDEIKDFKSDVTEIIEESLKSPPEQKQDPPTASGGGDSSQKEDSEADCAPLDHTKPVAVLRKDEEEKKLNKYKGTKKQKQKKKKEKTVKQVINVEVNFTGEREKYLQNEFDAPDEDAVAEQARNKYGDSNFSVPPDLHDRVQAFEKVYTPPKQPQFDDITNNLFSFFGDLLEAHGPLHVEDTRITSMVEDFPEDAKAKIEDCGGLSKFLQQSLKFAMIDDILCLLKDAVKAREISKARNTAWQTLKTNERDSVKSKTAVVYPQKPHKNPWKTVTKNQYSEKNSVYTDKVEFPSLLNSVSNESEPSFPVVQKEKPLYNKSYEMDNWDNVRSNKKSTVDTLDDFDDVVAKKGSMSALDDDFDLPPRKGGTKMDCIDMIDDIPLPAVNRKKSKKVKHIDDLDSIDSYSGSESESNQEGSIMSDRDSLSSEFSSSRSVQGKEKLQVNNRIHAGDWKSSDIKQDPPSVSRSSSKSDLSEKSGCELSSDLIAKSYMTVEPHRSPVASPSPVALTKEQSISAGSKFGPIGSPLTVENNRVERNSSGHVPQPLKIPSFNKKPPSTLQEEAEFAAAQEIYRNDSQLVNEIASKVMDQIYSGQSVPAAERMETFNRVKKDIWSDFNRDKQGGIHNSPGNASSLGMSFGQIPGHQNSKDDFTEQFMKKHYQQNMTDPLGQMKSVGEILPPRHVPLSTGYTNSPKTNVSSNLGFPSFHTPSENFPTPLSYPRSSAPLADVKFPDVIAVTSSIWTANVDNGLQSNHSFPRENYFHSFPSSNQPPSYKSDLFGSLSIGTSVVQSDKSFPSFSSPSNTDRIYGISLSRVNQCIQVSFETKCVETMTDPYEPYKLEYFQAKETQERLKSDLNAATSQIEELASLLQQSDRKGKEMEMEIQHQRQILEKQQSLMDEKAMLFGQELQRLTQELQKKEAMELELRQSLNAADQKSLDLQKQQNDERQINIQLQVEKTDALRNKEEFRKIMENEALRAQKSEIEELNTRQKYSIQMLEKSQKESFLYKQHLMGIIKKMEEDNMQVPQQLRDTVDKYNFIAVKCEETIKRLKSEFEEQIKQIREGKKLSGLKDIFIPPPPPPPPLQFPQLMKDQQAQHHGPSTTPMNMAHLQGGVTSLADSAMSKLPSSVSNPATSQIVTSVASTPVQPKPLGLPPGVQKPKPLVPPAGLASMQPRPMGGVNLHAMMNPATVGNRPQPPYKNSFEKLVQKLTLQFPNYNRAVFTQLIQEVRASRGGSLSGMTLDEIIHYIKETISKYEKSGFPVPGASPKQEKSSQISSQASSLSDFGVPLKKPVSTPAPSGGWHLPAHNFPSVSSSDFGMSQSEVFEEEEDPCVICHEEMTPVTTVRLECKHMFHDECIRKWLREQSTCPTCRIYALLPDEFPSLK